MLDPHGVYFDGILSRDQCYDRGFGLYVKNLADLGRDLSKVVIVEDNAGSFEFQRENALVIKKYYWNALEDTELEKIWNILEKLHKADDVRHIIADFPEAGLYAVVDPSLYE